MDSRTILVSLVASGLLAAAPAFAQTAPGGSSGSTDPSKAGQSQTQQPAPSATAPSGSSSTTPSTATGSGSTKPSTGTGSMSSGSGTSSTGTGSMSSGSGSATPSTGATSGTGSGSMSQGKAAGQMDKAGAMDKEKVKQLQEALKSKGHDPGPIDGIMGPKTQAALRDYQQKENVQSRADALQKLGVSQ